MAYFDDGLISWLLKGDVAIRYQVYRDLRDQSRLILNAGFSVVADATFLSRKHRKWFRELASELNIDFQILACQADTEVLRSRIKSRANDPSEATVQVLQKQVENQI